MIGGVLQSVVASDGITLAANANNVISISGATLGSRIDNLSLNLTQNINNLATTKKPLIQEATLDTILKNNKIQSLQGGERVRIADENDEVLRVNVDLAGIATESFAQQLLLSYTPNKSAH